MNKPKRYLITSALPYANGPKHIGHLAGAYLPADIYVRYLRAKKEDVMYVCGSDEHGAAITIQAMKENTTPRAIVDKYHAMLKSNMADLGISFDIYHRTSSPLHHETAQEFFTALNNKGDLEQKETEQFYDEEAKTFLADRYIIGTCPVCGNENAYGDQCEKCGTSLSPDQLINPRSTLSGNAPTKKLTTHWFLPLDKHEAFLREWILTEHKDDWKVNVLGQCKSWMDLGLQPRAVTRDLDWGVPLPSDVKGGEGKVLYVWFDAPIGYISATKQWALDNNKDWKPYWYSPDTKLVHFIGKDNIVFHAIIFPVMLKLHGNILPDNVPSNEFMNLEGDKMSTSRGWSIEMDDYINDFVKPENGGDQLVDALRYYLTQIAPETKDSEFTWKGFQDAVNSELVSIFGNFVNRAFVLMHKLCKGKVPPLHVDILDDADKKMFEEIENTKTKIENLIEGYKFRDALYEVIDLARKGNKYMQDKEPWIVAKKASLPSKGGFQEPANHNKPSNFSETKEAGSYSYQTANTAVYGLLKKFVEEHRSNPTEAEDLLWQVVKGRKLDSFKFRRQHIIGTYIADFVCLSQKLIVEVDGLIHEIPENKLSDIERTAELNKFGFEVLRFTNEEVINKTDYVLNTILSKLTEKKLAQSVSENPPLEGMEAQKQIDNCLHICLQLTANLAVFINPFLPFAAKKMCYMMKVVDKMLDWENAGKGKLLSVGYSLRPPELLFRKIEDDEVKAQVEKLKIKSEKIKMENKTEQPASEKSELVPDNKPEIQFDDFAKIDLKVGTILSAEKVEKADKLLKLAVDLGSETRTIVSGIALHFNAEDIIGRQVVVVANLAPRKMRGIESQGMILMAEDKAGKLHFVNPDTLIDSGSNVS
jgi:methionine--tRNA ligase/methionine--tRNA ligase beta chain